MCFLRAAWRSNLWCALRASHPRKIVQVAKAFTKDPIVYQLFLGPQAPTIRQRALGLEVLVRDLSLCVPGEQVAQAPAFPEFGLRPVEVTTWQVNHVALVFALVGAVI